MNAAVALVSSLALNLRKLTGGKVKVRPYQLFDIELKQRITISPSLTRFVFSGPDVASMQTLAPDQRIKLFFPAADGSLPKLVNDGDWHAARRALPAHQRPPMRTYTIRALRAERAEVDVEFVLHGETGPASTWATHAKPGDRLQMVAPHKNATENPGGYEWQPPANIRRVLLIGDETALPAIAGILETLAEQRDGPQVQAFIEVPHESDCQHLRCAPGTQLTWLPRDVIGSLHGEGMLHAARELAWLPPRALQAGKPVKDVDLEKKILWEKADSIREDFYAWVAGESAAVMAIRKHLINERGLDRKTLTLMGYWKLGRALD
ncbi:siderophore-interacting protein [Pseudomonas sp. NPDC090202]|uniref:siderophore-interacting protein n=1 Tax=unclassified Pseudomonas TaxID=196821 RepID=UPI0038139E4E